MSNFEELIVWQECRKFRNEVAELVKKFPPEEKYRLTDQLLRSSRSITAQIADGHGRFHYQENIQYCRQARGSLAESLDHLICAHDSKYMSDEELKRFRTQYTKCYKLLNGYISHLNTEKEKNKIDKPISKKLINP